MELDDSLKYSLYVAVHTFSCQMPNVVCWLDVIDLDNAILTNQIMLVLLVVPIMSGLHDLITHLVFS